MSTAENGQTLAYVRVSSRDHLVVDGKSVTEAARTLKISRATAYAALAQR